jgi:hypothetical protein
MWRLPLRQSILALTFLGLTLESPSEAPSGGLWRSPLAPMGEVFLAHLNLSFPYKWMLFSGIDIALVYVLTVALVRRAGDRRARESVPGAAPMRTAVLVAVAGAAWMWAWGMVRGDADVASSLWQLQRVGYVPLVFALFSLGIRGERDAPLVGRTIVAAACVKAMFAIYVRATVPPPPGEGTLAYATIHPDSMLFAGAFCIVVAVLLQRPPRKQLLVSALILPLLAAGMIANHRRVAWVELGAGLTTVVALTPSTPRRRALVRRLWLLSPVAALYTLVGWGSSSTLFAPVEVIRSVVDSKADASTAWRDWENYNLVVTLRQNPILGSGYGHGYIERVKLPDISQAYALYRFVPHNSILGLWAYGGLVGFTALWAMFVVGIFLAVIAAKRAGQGVERAAAVSSAASVVVYLVHCYGDMGLGTWTSVFTVAPALALASQLAVSTGAWPTEARRRALWRPWIRPGAPEASPALRP